MLRRIGVGYLLATLGILYAACLEVYRMKLVSEGDVIEQQVGDQTVIAARLSILAQAPGFLLIGTGEVLASITGLEFAENQAPVGMRSMVIAVFYLTTSLGNYAGSALVAIANVLSSEPWIGEDLNKSHMDLYFFLLTGIGFINFFAYIFISKRYVFH